MEVNSNNCILFQAIHPFTDHVVIHDILSQINEVSCMLQPSHTRISKNRGNLSLNRVCHEKLSPET